MRDPLLALGCRDPADRTAEMKARDPLRQSNETIFRTWWACHGDRPVSANDLDEDVQQLINPQGRARQFVASRLEQLTGTRSGGFMLTRQDPTGKWGHATYALKATNPDDPYAPYDHETQSTEQN